MKRYIKTICYLLLVMGVALIAPMAMSQEEDVNVTASPEKITAKVDSVNLPDSTLVITYPKDAASQEYNSEVIIVSDTTGITKGEEIVGLADLASGDEVVVEYVLDENGNKTAVNIRLE